jgi:glycine dehydrogenase
MTLARRAVKAKGSTILVLADTHPQIIAVMRTRAVPLGLRVKLVHAGPTWQQALASDDYFAVLVQYPASSGWLMDWSETAKAVHAKQAAFIVATDLLALTLLQPPAAMGADIVIGNSQRFGMPMGAGGPHAAFMACIDGFKRSLPGRLVGVSIDAHGHPAYRLALQTREQHIRREKATSNICTAQALPAIVAGMYAVYHGASGLTAIARRVARLTAILQVGLKSLELECGSPFETVQAFDTLVVITGDDTNTIADKAISAGANLRRFSERSLCVSLDETHTRSDVELLWRVFGQDKPQPDFAAFERSISIMKTGLIPTDLLRKQSFLTHPVFNSHQSETSMLRYLRSLSDKDLALDRCMIALGSCTMKLNATSEMVPMSWPDFANLHPYAPATQLVGYREMTRQLRKWLANITGYADVDLQPNAGSQGEFAGLLAIRAWHASRGQSQRNICLIPDSAHGTNPASAHMAGLEVVAVKCDSQGSVDLQDLIAKCQQHSDKLACIMLTYPSTHGVFETHIKQMCDAVHQHGGRVYIDGANMNALVGLAAPGYFGGDVSHINLHKTFCIPHGGGGPGVGPVCVAKDLLAYLPGSPTTESNNGHQNPQPVGPITAAALGNASALPISWMYIRMMGAAGLQRATECAILAANYISVRLAPHYATLFTGSRGYVAHECILDLRGFKDSCGITAEDVAKRLADYGLHAPTLSFPVAGTLMVEPTESEPLSELDRFCEAMIAIRREIHLVEAGEWPRDDNPLKNAPHTAAHLLEPDWKHPYSREVGAALAHAPLGGAKYWPPVARIDNAYGDRNLVPVRARD